VSDLDDIPIHPDQMTLDEAAPSQYDRLIAIGDHVLGLDAETIQSKFETFHAANPWVYDALVKMARRAKWRGRERLGIGMLAEVLRWDYMLATDDPSSDFKLNNNYRSRYARKIMEEHPELDGMFETRELHTP
jgi:hypothetical protein